MLQPNVISVCVMQPLDNNQKVLLVSTTNLFSLRYYGVLMKSTSMSSLVTIYIDALLIGLEANWIVPIVYKIL